ncbi:MAG TPA: molybdenum cofactor biosynthesis protein MoaE [Flavobacteriales bacterium]|nr:molybdenum cofactor biosynthesis protein MoaE [Flavobacteriales bacterium]HRO40954.1 molybdenum cofactor biosynthesis protein MoaE [Flavobacteriales bacterium]HRP81552.1 molybdenum cofactor biosynthesis protein MoaE [Flavobacteriales bacterium]HRQ84771.1 molybdenum cofactor biosynthesis protein MoaE [Flavobacteriales bacterium]
MSTDKPHKKRDIFIYGPIDPAFVAESIAKHASRTDIGGHEIFLGQVRADELAAAQGSATSALTTGNQQLATVQAIDYTAYRDMANEQMMPIREEAFARWPITCLHVYHSQGVIKAGELCFFVFASAAHRQAAREAVAYVTDEVKRRLPIFGKEIVADGSHQWKNNS